jgi:hypothetical protein
VTFLRTHRPEIIIVVALLVVPVAAAMHDRASRADLPREARERLAWETVSREAISRRQPPLWNPYYFGGQPLIGSPEAGAFYPPGLLLRLLPLRWFVGSSFVLHAWVLGIGVLLVLLLLGESRGTATAMALATMAAAALASPGFSTSKSLLAVAWLPLIAAASIHAARRVTRRPAAWVVLCLAIVMLGGSRRGIWYALATVIACYGWTLLWRRNDPTSLSSGVWQCGLAIALAAGLTGFHTVPAWWLASEVRRGHLLYAAESESPHPDPGAAVRRSLEQIGPHRTLSTCANVTTADLVNAHVPSVDGLSYYSADYASFASLASGAYPPRNGRYEGIATAGTRAARPDLLAWLGAEYLIACDSPDDTSWLPVGRTGSVAVYRAVVPAVQPTWTCPPVAVTRDQLEYELATRVYDAQLSLGGHRAIVHIRWTPQVTDAHRHDVEVAHGLAPVRFIGTRTWQYALEDVSEANVRSLVTNPAVEDTAHIGRMLEVQGPPRPAAGAQPKTEWLIGAEPCQHQAAVHVVRTRQFRGRAVMQVDAPVPGVVVLPEPYIPGRRVWVDGAAVTPLRVNLAFMAVPVDRGPHRIDLSYMPTALRVGLAVSAFSLLAWVVALRRSPARST